MTPRWVLRAKQGRLTLLEHLIPLLFCKGILGFQTFVYFVFILSFILFQICLVSFNYAFSVSHMGFLHWNYYFVGHVHVCLMHSYCLFVIFELFQSFFFKILAFKEDHFYWLWKSHRRIYFSTKNINFNHSCLLVNIYSIPLASSSHKTLL